jgi:hypothetical protein
MNVIFLIPVRHEDGVEDYGDVWQRLISMLRSIANQTVPNWHAMVVANKVLPIPSDLPSRQITFVELQRSFIGCSPAHWDEDEFREHLIDKAVRRHCGVVAAMQQDFKAAWYFMADADDYVANDLVSTILSTTELHHKIVTLQRGLLLTAKQEYVELDQFSEHCGTSIAIRSSLIHDNLHNNNHVGALFGQHSFQHFEDLCRHSERHVLGQIPRVTHALHTQNYRGNLWDASEYLVDTRPLTEKIRKKFQIPS